MLWSEKRPGLDGLSGTLSWPCSGPGARRHLPRDPGESGSPLCVSVIFQTGRPSPHPKPAASPRYSSFALPRYPSQSTAYNVSHNNTSTHDHIRNFIWKKNDNTFTGMKRREGRKEGRKGDLKRLRDKLYPSCGASDFHNEVIRLYIARHVGDSILRRGRGRGERVRAEETIARCAHI